MSLPVSDSEVAKQLKAEVEQTTLGVAELKALRLEVAKANEALLAIQKSFEILVKVLNPIVGVQIDKTG